MSKATDLTLTLNTGKLNDWYTELAKQAPNSAHQLAVTVALQSFVLAMNAPGQRGTEAEREILKSLDAHAVQVREHLLAENTKAIGEALSRQDSRALSAIHHAISRRGFEITAKRAIEEIAPETLLAAASWASNWCAQAKARAEAASGFPDALDFHKAGINPLEYAAMKDVEIYLGAANPRARSA